VLDESDIESQTQEQEQEQEQGKEKNVKREREEREKYKAVVKRKVTFGPANVSNDVSFDYWVDIFKA